MQDHIYNTNLSTYLVPTLLPHLLTSPEHNNSLKLLREAKGQRNFESEENYLMR